MRHPANNTLAAMQQILLPWPPDFLLNSWGCIGSDCPSPFADGWMRNRLSIMNHDVDHYWQWLTAHWSESPCIFNAHWSSNMSRITGKNYATQVSSCPKICTQVSWILHNPSGDIPQGCYEIRGILWNSETLILTSQKTLEVLKYNER